MNRGLWISRKNHLWCTIRKISYLSGGDDAAFLEGHFLKVLDGYPEERIEEAITCYKEILEQLEIFSELSNNSQTTYQQYCNKV